MEEIEVGDLVRLKREVTPITVTHVTKSTWSGEYSSGNYSQYDRPKRDALLVKKANNPMEDQMTKLFKTKDGDYGTQLTKDSAGNIVLELKGGKGVREYPLSDLEEVMPYTVEIKQGSSHKTHFEVTKGSLKVDDVVLVDLQFPGVVTRIDTKKRDCQQAKLVKVLVENV